jgi:hypothetical protein
MSKLRRSRFVTHRLYHDAFKLIYSEIAVVFVHP